MVPGLGLVLGLGLVTTTTTRDTQVRLYKLNAV